MSTGAITGYIDVAQLVLYAFWIFFAGLIYYLHQENKREGYPLESDRSERSGGRVKVQGWPPIPKPKTYLLRDGRTVTAPPGNGNGGGGVPAARPAGGFLGAPLVPQGDPMQAGVGPGSYTQRADVPDTTLEGDPRLVPLRAAAGFDVAAGDTDPRGLPVVGADGAAAGTVRDLWVDRAEMLFRYLEVEVGTGAGARRVLLPINFAVIGPRRIEVQALLGRQFAGVPATRSPEQVTLLEEEKVMAYYGAGTLYATPARAEPLL